MRLANKVAVITGAAFATGALFFVDGDLTMAWGLPDQKSALRTVA